MTKRVGYSYFDHARLRASADRGDDMHRYMGHLDELAGLDMLLARKGRLPAPQTARAGLWSKVDRMTRAGLSTLWRRTQAVPAREDGGRKPVSAAP